MNRINIDKSNKYRRERQISGSGETDDSSKYDEVTTPKPDQGGEVKEIDTGNRRVNHSRGRIELVQLHTANRYFRGNTPEVGAVLGLLSKTFDIGAAFDNFGEKLKSYVERYFENVKDVLCVLIDMEDMMKQIEDNNILGYLYEEESNFIPKKKILELSLTRYMDR